MSVGRPRKVEYPSQSIVIYEVINMNMEEVVKRINELAAKAKAEGLNEEELAERDKLRRIYIDSYKASLTGQLDNTYIVRPDGTKEKLNKKG